MVTTIVPSGINRSMSGQNSPDGVCEEILNARYKNGSWRVVGKKKKIVEGVNYEQVFIHKYGTFENYIGVRAGQVIWLDPVTKEEKQTVCITSGKVVFNQMNNILLVKDERMVVKAIYEGSTRSYKSGITALPAPPELIMNKDKTERLNKSNAVSFKIDGVTYDKGTTGIDCGMNDNKDDHIEDGSDMDLSRGGISFPSEQLTPVMESLIGLYRKTISQKKGFAQGYIFLRVAYELFDGSITKPTVPVLVKLGDAYDPNIIHCSQNNFDDNTSVLKLKFYIKNTKVSMLQVSVPQIAEAERYKDVIKYINVYASKVIDYYDDENADAAYLHFTTGDGKRYNLVHSDDKTEGFPEQELENSVIDNMLFYQVAQFDFINPGDKVAIKFEDILTSPTMPVDGSGWLNMTGGMFVYNNRLHLFNIHNSITKYSGMFRFDDWRDRTGEMNCCNPASFVVYMKDSIEDVRTTWQGALYYRQEELGMCAYMPGFMAFADSRAYKVEVYFTDGSRKYMGSVSLRASKSYNFSYYVRNMEESRVVCKEVAGDHVVTDNVNMEANNNILVSGVSNPYFFPPEHSYLMSGDVVDMAVSTEQISEAQTGQFPVYVFTTEGIYALQVGEGNVLYSNIVPVSSQVAIGKVLQTKYGIVFPTQDGIKIISGREIVNLSEVVCGEPDWSIRKSGGFDFCFYDHPELHNAKDYLCDCDFKKYVENAVMGYDMMEDELIVSNPVKRYSFVYGFQSKMWHKITEVFNGFSRTIAYTHKDNLSDIVDLTAESEDGNMFHMHMGPIRLGTEGFKRIGRVAARGSFMPAAGRRSSMYVYCSNDAITWQMVQHLNVFEDWTHYWKNGSRESFRYMAIILGSETRGGYLLSHCEVDYGNVLDRKLR